MAKSVLAPQKAQGNYTPLEQIAAMTFRRYGDFSDVGVQGDVLLMLIELANRVVEDVNGHPYAVTTAADIAEYPNAVRTGIDYYVTQTDSREIPDLIVLDGLVYHYALQQMSQKAENYSRLYMRTLNGILYNRKYGNSSIDVVPVEYSQTPGVAP